MLLTARVSANYLCVYVIPVSYDVRHIKQKALSYHYSLDKKKLNLLSLKDTSGYLLKKAIERDRSEKLSIIRELGTIRPAPAYPALGVKVAR